MQLSKLPAPFTVCKLHAAGDADLCIPFTFLSYTDEEISLVCPTAAVPARTVAREDGWRALKIAGVLDFGMVGVIASLAGILAAQRIPVFVVSTYNTDYILLKGDTLAQACALLTEAGHTITEGA